MKILIVGAGVIGTIYGWAISEAGHSVTHLVMPGKSSRFNDGINLDIMDRRKGFKKWYKGNYHIKVTESVSNSDHYDLIIVPVRHYMLEETLRQIVPLASGTDFVLLTQNWKGIEEIDAILPRYKYVFGDAKAGGSFQNGILVGTIYAIDLGAIGDGNNPCLSKAVELFRSAKIKTTVQKNILHYLWIQYALNGGMWPSLIKAGSIKEVFNDNELMYSVFISIKECLNIVSARGVNLTDYPETEVFIKNSSIKLLLYKSLMKFMFLHNEYFKRNSAHALADSIEIKTFYYDLINSGKQLKVDTPVMLSFMEDMNKFKI